jgi:hypothetical protein
MKKSTSSLLVLRREHPLFFWGTVVVMLGLLAATIVVAIRIPQYRSDAAALDQRMSETERATRDGILQSETRRAELAVALLRREFQLKALHEKEIHLALDIDKGTISLRHGPATLREAPMQIGPDSLIRAPDGRTWRFVRPVGERHVQEKQVSPEYTIPEWVFISRGETVPEEEKRRLKGGLGKYVLRLDDGSEIYSEPETGPFAGQVKPASFVVPEKDLQAIFDAIGREAPVYIY